MRCQNEESDSDDSDPEIQLLKKKIIERRSVCKSNRQKISASAFSDPSDTGRSSTSFKTSSTFSSSISSTTGT